MDPDGVDDDADVEGVVVEDGLGKLNNVVGGLRWLMRSFFSNGNVLMKKLLIDLNVGLSNDLVVGDRWKMTDVKERPLDDPKEGLAELLFCRKASDMSGFVDVVA